MDGTDVAVASVDPVGPDAVALELEAPPGFDAHPGQFVKLGLTVDGEAVSRFYTVSSPFVRETFEVTVGVDPDGAVSPHLRALEPGDVISLSGPYGSDYYEGEPSVLVLAGGPGIGAAIGVAERAIADGGTAAIVYRDDAPLHESRLAAIADVAPVLVLGSEASLAAAVATTLTADQQVFVYGFADFLADAVAALEAAGGRPTAAKMENYG